MTTVGIIGGTGLYGLEEVTITRELQVDTPFGQPSAPLVLGELAGVHLVFLPRHGRGHRLLPTEVPYRANVFALKSLGVEWLISVSAVGSMRESLHPGEVVIPSQYVDMTRARPSTFFGDGLAAHVSMADPICAPLGALLAEAARACQVPCHEGGTYVCIEGPTFSTRAESTLYRSWGVDIIGMTAMPEARLAREAEIHYATLALVTDYDCWHATEGPVSVGGVIALLKQHRENVQKILSWVVTRLPGKGAVSACGCAHSLANAIVTHPDSIPSARRDALRPLVGKYL